MMIKTYITKDMKEAITRAKYELGKEAMIVSHREVRPGNWFNPFRKRMLEVTFALEDRPMEKEDVEKETQESATPEPPTGEKPTPQKPTPEKATSETPRKKVPSAGSTDKLPEQSTPIEEGEEIEKPLEEETLGEETLGEEGKDPFYQFSGSKTKERLLGYCRLHNKTHNLLSRQERKEFFKIVAADRLYSEEMDFSKINVLVGPTGVGKTTTIAKLAAMDQLGNKKKVGLITLDTYRIGAVEQLKTYAEILSIPLRVVNSPEEMAEKVKSLMHCDRILIDTLGTSPKDLEKLTEIKNSLQAAEQDINTYLVVSMATDRDTMDAIFRRYEMLKYQALLITKLDEVENTKNLWHVVEKGKAPLQYFCYGQNVPEDISRATPEKLFNYFEENAYADGSGR